MTLRDVVHGNLRHVRLVELADQGVTLDMDTPADYQVTLKRFVAGVSESS